MWGRSDVGHRRAVSLWIRFSSLGSTRVFVSIQSVASCRVGKVGHIELVNLSIWIWITHPETPESQLILIIIVVLIKL